MPKTTIFALKLSLVLCIVGLATHPLATTQNRQASSSDAAEEEMLRIRLQADPHDARAHEKLTKLLHTQYAFRSLVNEDINWLRNNPSDYRALLEVVSFSEAALNDPELSIEQLRTFIGHQSRASDPFSYDDLIGQLAGKLENRNRVSEALPLLDELVRLNPNEAGFCADYGDALSALGRHQEAISAIRRAIGLDPSIDWFHTAMARAFLRFGDLRAAETEYKAALSLYEAEFKKGESTDTLARKLIKIQADSHEEGALAETHLKLAHVLLLEKKYEEAIAETRSALSANRYEFAALYLRAQIYEAKGDPDAARKSRDEASAAIGEQAAKEHLATKSPGIDPRVLFLNDSLWNEPGHPAFASEIVSILEPNAAALSPPARVELATAYFELGRVSDAKRQWESAIASDQTLDNASSHAHLSEELWKAGAVNDAVAHLQRAYELDPQNLTYRMDYEKAKGSAESAKSAQESGHRRSMLPIYAIIIGGLLLCFALIRVALIRKRRVSGHPKGESVTPISDSVNRSLDTVRPASDNRRATEGELLAVALQKTMDREGACLGATVLYDEATKQSACIGSNFHGGAGAEIDKALQAGFLPVGVFVVTQVDGANLKTLVVTHKSVSEADEPRIKKIIHACANEVFPGLIGPKIAKA